MQEVHPLEYLVANVMLGPLLTGFGADVAYADRLTSLAFDETRNHFAFRSFLQEYREYYSNFWEILEGINDDQIDYVLDRVKEERAKFIAEQMEEMDDDELFSDV